MFMDEGFSISDSEEGMKEEDEDEEPYKRLKHIYLKSDCGLCNQPMGPNQWTLALIGNPEGTKLVKCTKKFQYPGTRQTIRVRGILPLCQRNECGRCSKSPPSITIHASCYRVFMKEYRQKSAMERIWVASCWKFPWLHDPVQLTPRLSLNNTAKAFIQNVAESMSSSEAKIESYPLASIKSWQRGLPVVCDKGESKEFVLRLTVDGDGLNKIEKLESWPEYSQVRSNAFAYLFVLPSQAEDSHIDFKFGRAFLRKSLRFGFGEFWDTPTPLKNGLSMFATPFNRYGAVRFRTVDLCNITGLTFFYFRGYMMGIHAHTADSPTATSTLDEISAIDPKYLIWAYVPISSKDSLVRIGVRDSLDLCLLPAFKKPTVLISTKLAGDFVLGPDYKYAMKEYLSAKDPSVFVYNVPYNRYHSMYGAVNDNKGDEPLAPFPRTYATGGCPPYRGRIYSQAPAKDIVHVDVYYEEATGYCRGLLLEYANGAQMALGQCRVGIDPFKSFDKPNWLCYAYSSNGKTFNRIGQCKIECSTGSDTHDHDQSGMFYHWACTPLEGTLEFACDHRMAGLQSYVDIEE
ncbi:uncharacterized protein FFB20_15730 [Fusarium fujikuroi]|uniref:Uncharacterized protein n=1 Tax=Gibberella fujikuroi (strain CBS 195.34 / IMI 58289 / NRRL A-6831) TaxID=1279085 RepID=S0DKR2_GIBF5|nr:uncharacterized protein FFUJ_00407 [Fusarium fujikuroi IMI 58289]KLO93010.1 uncharacterized protein Y057_1486 [Fusarium fujikuroi]KLP14584.1 uncharacterized protein LW94_1040 [Fusarium fujikuroi]CCT62986.1 uncharacterized protein FFUJ_00407 [Fusarium fujikuroi IMI 58289]SCN66430.1 uncharacterized protein FFE2_00455 [Fusarium fujikuroi]SCN69348.1 uncharacterized protein FFC1_00451 [Fusarium fujikuroi]